MLDVAKFSVLAIVAVGGFQGSKVAPKQAGDLQVKLTLGKPVQVDRITIVPIESTIPLARDQYMTLAEATKFGMVEIVEMPGQEQVNSLEVRNKGKLPILLFAGELLLGGKQDRIVAKDSIVPALERRDVPVFCVEHGRWDGKPVFQSGDTLVANEVRQTAVHKADQSAVWAQVAESNRKVAAAPATGTYRGTLADPKTKAVSDRSLRDLNAKFVPTSRTIGVICCINGKIESADIYANPSLFNQSRSKLFHSYALDAALAGKGVAKAADMKACSTFLSQIVSARRSQSASGRDGKAFSVMGGSVDGLETGTVKFNGGFGGARAGKGGRGGGGAAGEAGFSHGTYKPKSDKGGN